MSDYVYQPYPAWRHHPDHGMRLVNSKEEDEELLAQDGWVDSHMKLPANQPVAEAKPAPKPAPEPDPESDDEPADDEPKRPRSKRK